MAHIVPNQGRSLKEFRLLPRYTPESLRPDTVSLETRLCRRNDGYLRLHAPILSAAMQAVTDADMAIAIAQLGGIGILPVSQASEKQCSSIDAVKRFKAGFQTNIVTLAPEQAIGDVIEIMSENGYSTFPVTDNGLFHGNLVGIITDKDFDERYDRHCRVGDRMKTDVQVGVELDNLKEANTLMIQYGRGFLPIVSNEGVLLSVVFKKDLDKHIQHPYATVDDQKRLCIGAAVSTHPEDRKRVSALVEHEVDVIVIDASDGHTQFQQDLITWIKSRYDVPVIGGNIVTGDGFRFLADAGADAVKVGMGIGSGCITQVVKATGRGQASTLMDVCSARDEMAAEAYIPVIADGGINGAGAMTIALALGADAIMAGNLLARFTESPGSVIRNADGEIVKEYWMEGSMKARNYRRYAQLEKTFFEEGVNGHVPHEGSIYDKLPPMMQMVRASFATAGCSTIDEMHEHAILETQSLASLQDGDVHAMTQVQMAQEVVV